MKSSLTAVVGLLVATFVQAGRVWIRANQDVYVPAIIEPTKESVWGVGSVQNVTWDVKHQPKNITNEKGSIVLSKAGRLLLHHTLAEDFDIRRGHTAVKVPNVEPGKDYAIVLFGDSGNASPVFKIV